MKKIIPIFLLVVSQLNAQFLSKNENRVVGYDQVIAVVEDRSITREELMREMQPLIAQVRSQSRSESEFNSNIERISKEIVDNIINKVLIVKDFRDQGMTIPKSYLDAAFDDHMKSQFNNDRAEFLKYLKSQNKTIKQFRKDQEEDIIVGYMQNKQRTTASQISPARMLEYYEKNKQKWYTPESVKISMITLKSPSIDSLDETKSKAINIIEELKKGLSFEDAAKKYSMDENAQKGGAWGEYKKGELSPKIDEVAFNLKEGSFSDPIIVENYVYIILLNKKSKEGIKPIDEVREEIEWTMVGENAAIENKKWVERLRKKAYIKYY